MPRRSRHVLAAREEQKAAQDAPHSKGNTQRMWTAITRKVSGAINECELTHLERSPIDLENARRQHSAYEALLQELGCRVISLDEEPDYPDSVFVEDTAVVLDEIAVIMRPGAESRRGEVESIASVLGQFRPLAEIRAPATIDGGDVLVVGRDVLVGLSARTNQAGVDQLRTMLVSHGYAVRCVDIFRHLHLKSAATLVRGGDDPVVLIDRASIDPGVLGGVGIVETDPEEPLAANALLVGEVVLFAAGFPRTEARLRAKGISLASIDASELAKAEAGLTCCSLVFRN